MREGRAWTLCPGRRPSAPERHAHIAPGPEPSISAVHAEIRAICLVRAVRPCVSSRASVDAMTTRQRVEDILTTDEIAGFELFVDPANCTQCHNFLAALWPCCRGPVVQQPPGYPVIRSRPCRIKAPPS